MFSWRLLRALYAPDSYALVLLLILVTYALSAALTASWATSLTVAIQIAAVWVTLRAARARRTVLAFANIALGVAAPVAIVRHLLSRRTIDSETVMGAIAAYLMVGMFFAFLYRAVGIVQPHPAFFGSQGPGTFSQDLFFSFTTLTTTGYGDLTPAGNPGQSFAVLEMLIGQLFLITAVGKVVSTWRPGQGRGGLREKHEDDQ